MAAENTSGSSARDSVSSSVSRPNTKNCGSRITSKNLENSNTVASSIPEAKWIHVYINGDEHFSGFKCVVNSRHYRNFDVFLSYLTERLQPSFGAIRNIYTPISGHCVHNLEELLPNQKYVVAGGERFKKLEPGYADIGERYVRRPGWKPVINKAKPAHQNQSRISKTKQSASQHTVTLHFYKNGSDKVQPYKLILRHQELEDWDGIFQKIGEKLKCGFVKRLYTLDGKPIKSAHELVNGQSYVAVGKYEVFKRAAYGNLQHKSKSPSRLSRNHSRLQRKSPSFKPQRTTTAQSSISQALSVSLRERTSGKRNINYSANSNISKTKHEERQNFSIDSVNKNDVGSFELLADEDSIFRYKNAIKKELQTQVKEVDLDNDWSGIYRAKLKNELTQDAIEIQDDPETAVELPLDHLDPEEIEEEITPDMERSMQNLSLDVPEELVAFLPSMQGKHPAANDRNVSSDKYNLSQSQNVDVRNIFA